MILQGYSIFVFIDNAFLLPYYSVEAMLEAWKQAEQALGTQHEF